MFRDDNQILFAEGDLRATLREHFAKIPDKIGSIPRDQFLNTPEDALIEHFVAELSVAPIETFEDSTEMEQEETKIEITQGRREQVFHDSRPVYVPGLKVRVSVPYTGDPLLWRLRPSHGMGTHPRGNVRQPGSDGVGYLDIVIELPSSEDPKRFKELLGATLDGVRFYLGNQKTEIEGKNASLPNLVRQAIRDRRERLKKHDGIIEMLDIPLKRREGVPAIRPIPFKRKLVRPLPPAPKQGFKPEPGITDEDYEHILGVIRHEGRTFETTPATYAVHDEGQLRDILLAHLNGHYCGDATGETFRGRGPTDIRIESADRAAFVAECKIWRGPKRSLNGACDQLLSYLIWRECKAAIVLFNKHNAGFTQLLEKVPQTLTQHPCFKRDLGPQGEGEWRFVFSSRVDELRRILVHTFLFNLYVAP